jgi:hypothetical protein
LIPDPANPDSFTGTPISINTLNPGVPGANGQSVNGDEADLNWADYSVYYVTNTTNTYEYDGRTQVLEVRWPVVPSQTYHMKMATGDGGDAVFDSAFLLGANSFRTTSPPPNGVEELSLNAFAVYTNSASDLITISPTDESMSRATVERVDLQGKQVLVSAWTSAQPRIDISGITTGLYILSISTVDGLISQELLTVE